MLAHDLVVSVHFNNHRPYRSVLLLPLLELNEAQLVHTFEELVHFLVGGVFDVQSDPFSSGG